MVETKIEMTVHVPDGNGYSDPESVERIEQHFKELGGRAQFRRVYCKPSQDEDCNYTVYADDVWAAELAEKVLTGHYGLEITKRKIIVW